MSASLVGSEMCIRDSPLPRPVGARALREGPLAQPLVGGHARLRCRRPDQGRRGEAGDLGRHGRQVAGAPSGASLATEAGPLRPGA
eukprot:12905146-Alexandrium_andersonii.AAC.1